MIPIDGKTEQSRTFQKIKNDSIYYAARAVMAFAGWIPLSWGLRLGDTVGRGAFFLLRQDREKTLTHLKVAFPEKTEAWRRAVGRRSFAHLGMSFFELFHFDELLAGVEGKGKWTGYLRFQGREHMEAQMAEGRGGLFIVGHIGNWELMAAFVSKSGFPVNTIVRQLYDKRIDKLLNDHRIKYNYRPIWRVGKEAIPEIVRVFQDNEFMGLLMDQDTKVRGVFAPFFGHSAYTPSGPAYLAYQADLDAIPAFMHRRPEGGHTFVTYPPIPRPKTGDMKEDIKNYTALLNQAIERQIRAHPDEWVWMHRRWKTRPPGEHPAANPVLPRPRPRGLWRLMAPMMSALAPRFSWQGADRFGDFLGRAAALLGARRKEAFDQMDKALPGLTAIEKNLAYQRSLREGGRNLVRYFRTWKMDASYFGKNCRVENIDLVQERLKAPKGLLLAGVKTGAWEAGLFVLASLGYDVAIVGPRTGAWHKRQWLSWARRRGQVYTLKLEEDNREVLDFLARGGIAAFLLDDKNHDADDWKTTLASNGRRVAAVAAQSGADVLFFQTDQSDPGRLVVRLDEALEPDGERLIEIVDRMIRQAPGAYGWPFLG